MKNDQNDSEVNIDPETGFVVDLVDEALSEISEEGEDGRPNGPDVGAGLSQVREILFGDHARTLQQRLSALEDKLDRSVASVTEVATKRIDGLEQHLRGELNRLNQTLGRLSEDAKHAQENLGTELSDRIDAMAKELEQRHDDLRSRLTREAERLRAEFVDRASLHEALTGLVGRLEPPSGDGQA